MQTINPNIPNFAILTFPPLNPIIALMLITDITIFTNPIDSHAGNPHEYFFLINIVYIFFNIRHKLIVKIEILIISEIEDVENMG